MNQRVFAESPSIARQQGADGDGVVDIYLSNQAQNESNKTNRSLNYKDPSKPRPYNSVDIGSFSYLSDGKVLNATLSFPSPINLNALNSSDATLKYGMLIDADYNSNTGWKGIDYKIEIEYFNKNDTWIKVFQETLGELPVRDTQNYSTTFDDQRYVKLSADLQKMGFPNLYKAVFYAEIKDGSAWYIDFTPWIRIPPPEVSISVSSNPLPLTKGESKPVQVNIKSVPGFSQPTVNLTLVNRDREEITITGCDCTNVTLTSSGEGTVNPRVEVKEKAQEQSYKIDIRANATFPYEPFDFDVVSESINIGEYDVSTVRRQVYSSMLVDVIPIDYSKHLGTIAVVVAIIGGMVAVFAKLLDLLKKKKKKQEEQSSTTTSAEER